MSWLYTLIFASLLIPSDPEAARVHSYPDIHTAAENIAVKDEIEKFDQTYSISPNGRISVSNVNGSIEIIAWDRKEVRLEATKIADSRESLADVELKIDSRADSFSVETHYKDWNWKINEEKNRNRKIEVHFKLSVPRTAMLSEIETVNGSVNAANFVNFTKISAVNGDVIAVNLRGTANLSTVNGTVSADFDRLEQGTKINLSTVNGRINLNLPSDSNATVRADSLNGSITNAFGLPVRKGEYVGRDLHGRLGNGGVQIKLDSVNGPLSINKKDDGKPASPATNLLPAKGERERPNDSDSRGAIITERMNREVKIAMREAQREAAKAAREASRELAKVKIPELEKLKVEIDSRAIEAQIEESLKGQELTLGRMRDAMWFGDAPMVQQKSNAFRLKGPSNVVVDARNCNVRIRGWDKPEVKYVLTETQRFGEVSPLNVRESQSATSVNISVSGGDSGWTPRDSDPPRLEIFVPRKSNLKIITKGEIRLEGVSGDIDLSGGESSIDVRGSEGKLDVSNTDGVVRIVGFKGNLSAKTHSGEVYLDGDFGRIDASGDGGKFVLTVPEGIDADIQAPSGNTEAAEIPNAKKLSDSSWRLGNGGRTYKFISAEGSLEIRNRELIGGGR